MPALYATPDLRNRHGVDAVPLPYLSAASDRYPNLSNLSIRQLCVRVILSAQWAFIRTRPSVMRVVFCWRHPFQILCPIVGFIRVLVIDLTRACRKKSSPDQAMHGEVPSSPVLTKLNLWISIAILRWLEDASRLRGLSSAVSSHTPQIRNAIPANVTRDRLPTFLHKLSIPVWGRNANRR